MILHRCFAWDEASSARRPNGPLWFPRSFQGDGRHDNPDAYGCLYLADRPVSAAVEQLARFRGQRLSEPMLRRRGLPLAIAAVELADEAEVIDLDEPRVLRAERLRPSVVATRARRLTQDYALALHERHAGATALRWWSVFESLWPNFTVFDRAARMLRVLDVERLTLAHPAVAEAADALGLA